MSNEAVNLLLDAAERAELAPGPRFVLYRLADRGTDHSGEDWTCFPSVDRLMRDTGFKRSAIEGHLKVLERGGWISRVRRVRPDGRMGIYDYTLHRDPAVREGLRAERNGETARAAGEGAPCVKSTHGPCADSGAAMRGFGPEPCSESEHLEPSENPQREPSLRARARPEPGDEGVGEALAAWPASGLKRTDEGRARAGWARICGEVDAERLLAAVRLAAASGELEAGDYGAPGLHVWLDAGRWKPWLAELDAAEAERRSAPAWAGPADVGAVVEAAVGRFAAAACGWDAGLRQVLAPTSRSRDQLGEAAVTRALAALDPPVTVSPTLKPKA